MFLPDSLKIPPRPVPPTVHRIPDVDFDDDDYEFDMQSVNFDYDERSVIPEPVRKKLWEVLYFFIDVIKGRVVDTVANAVDAMEFEINMVIEKLTKNNLAYRIPFSLYAPADPDSLRVAKTGN